MTIAKKRARAIEAVRRLAKARRKLVEALVSAIYEEQCALAASVNHGCVIAAGYAPDERWLAWRALMKFDQANLGKALYAAGVDHIELFGMPVPDGDGGVYVFGTEPWIDPNDEGAKKRDLENGRPG